MKPDASNILKLVEDALNGIAYKDDSQIVASIPLKAPRLGTFDWIEIEVTYCKDANA
jgi:Holliday junction resolvase RusA-like endonuclease